MHRRRLSIVRVLLLTCFANPVLAQYTPSAFAERKAKAEAVERTHGASQYWRSGLFPRLAPQMHAALQACLQAENADRKTFTLLADVEASGKLSKVDVYPETNTAKCFSVRASKFVVDPPPSTLPCPFPVVVQQHL